MKYNKNNQYYDYLNNKEQHNYKYLSQAYKQIENLANTYMLTRIEYEM